MTRPESFTESEWSDVCGEATALLQTLLRIDTTNPPGDEIKAARALAQDLEGDGISCEIIESAPGRANLITRLESGTDEPPLLLSGHLDVVKADEPERWTHPPFGGVLADGYIWGRGAVDMKNFVAMSAMMLKLLRRREVPLKRDIIFAAVADEEDGTTFGSKFLVEQHPDKVRAGYALCEGGGFTMDFKGAAVCPVETAEKGKAFLRITARGPSGHGSMPMADSALLRLSEALTRVGATHLPQHTTDTMAAFIRGLADLAPYPERLVLPRLLSPATSGFILDKVLKGSPEATKFHTMLRNTAVPTSVRAGDPASNNIIPGEAVAELDGRLLPGQTGDDLVAELREVVGDDELSIEVMREFQGRELHPPESPLWSCIIKEIGRRDRALKVLPLLLPGFTDMTNFSRLGTRCYGFAPVKLDPRRDPPFAELFHGFDERIPEDGYHWGLGLLWDVVRRFVAA